MGSKQNDFMGSKHLLVNLNQNFICFNLGAFTVGDWTWKRPEFMVDQCEADFSFDPLFS